jgi:hypothetical protein
MPETYNDVAPALRSALKHTHEDPARVAAIITEQYNTQMLPKKQILILTTDLRELARK